jgi:hypothetical protein
MNIWAHRVDNFIPQNGGEWDATLKFDKLGDLLQQFSHKKIPKGQVRKLAIVAHGNTRGSGGTG